jgi:hypothetical protein
MNELIIIPDPAFRRHYEKILEQTTSTLNSSSGYYTRKSKPKFRDSDFSDDSGDETKDANANVENDTSGDYWLPEVVDVEESTLSTKRQRSTEKTDLVINKPKKKSSKACFARNCDNEFGSGKDSLYCSDKCAYLTCSETLSVLLDYRILLCASLKPKQISKDDMTNIKKLVLSGDLKYFSFRSDEEVDDSTEMIENVAKLGFITLKSPDQMIKSKDFHVRDKRNYVDNSVQDFFEMSNQPKSPASTDKKTTVLQNILCDLPVAAVSVFCRGESDSSSNAIDQEMQIRLKVRYAIEDFFMKTFSRLNVAGSTFLGSMFALELEEELYHKYSTPGKGHFRTDFNKKEYLKHQLMLTRNLKQSHNDQLVIFFFFYSFYNSYDVLMI